MQTCKVGEKIINCFDGKYDKYTLKQWSNKNKLICPDCNKAYEYCHGRIIPPYFRHKEKNIECDGIYSEPETLEHINGKLLLYNWLLKMQEDDIVQNLKLEAYIPVTKQRPDIYFECNDYKYVVEFQCSPIATEYLERHELYQLANINDIWILGTDKYNINVNDNGLPNHKNYYKAIEKHSQFYLEVKTNDFIIINDNIKTYLPYNATWLSKYYRINMNDFEIDNDLYNFKLSDKSLNKFIEKDRIKYNELIEQDIKNRQEEEIINKLVKELNKKYENFDNGIYFFEKGSDGYFGRYKYKILFNVRSSNTHFGSFIKYTFFIKNKQTDCCIDYQYTKSFIGKKGGLGWNKCTGQKNIDSVLYEFINKDILKKFILDKVCGYIRKTKYEN